MAGSGGGAYIPAGHPPPSTVEPYVPMSLGIPFPPPVMTVPPPNMTTVVGGGIKRSHDGGYAVGEPPHKRFE